MPGRWELVGPDESDECVEEVADEVADAFSGMPNPLFSASRWEIIAHSIHEHAIILVGLS